MDFRSCAFPPRRRFAFLRSPPRVCPPKAVCLGEIPEDTVRQSGGTCANPLLSRPARRPRRTLPARAWRERVPSTDVGGRGRRRCGPGGPPATPRPRTSVGFRGISGCSGGPSRDGESYHANSSEKRRCRRRGLAPRGGTAPATAPPSSGGVVGQARLVMLCRSVRHGIYAPQAGRGAREMSLGG